MDIKLLIDLKSIENLEHCKLLNKIVRENLDTLEIEIVGNIQKYTEHIFNNKYFTIDNQIFGDVVNKHLKNRKNEMLLIITNEDYSLTANNNNNSYAKKSKHESSVLNIKKDLSMLPSAERPSVLMKIIEEHQQLPKISKKK